MRKSKKLLGSLFAAGLVMAGFPACNAVAGIFPIATNASLAEACGGLAFDGTNYLASLVSGTNVSAQFISQTGTLIGSAINVGQNGGFPPNVALAFGRTNYLIAWSDASINSGVDMFGQFISVGGAKSGPSFPLLSSVGSHGFQAVKAMAFDGTNFLAIWQDGNDRSLYGQFVTQGGTLSGAAHLISSQQQNSRDIALAFGSTNYLAAWQSNNGEEGNTRTYGAFVSPGGAVTSPLQLSQTASIDQNPLTIAFDGTNFFVVWNTALQQDTNGTPIWDLFARQVSPAGTFPGNELALVTDAGSQAIPAAAFDGMNYLVCWSDYPGSNFLANSTVRGRFFNRSASPIGPEITLFTPSGTNTAAFAFHGAFYDGAKFAVAATIGTFAYDTNGQVAGFPAGDVYGTFLARSTASPVFTNMALVNGRFQGQLSVTPGQTYTIFTSSNLLSWTPVTLVSSTNTDLVTVADPRQVSGFSRLFYRAAVGNLVPPSFDLSFMEFASAGNFSAGFTPVVSYPAMLDSYSALLNAQDDPHFPSPTDVFYTGPAGSGLSHTESDTNNFQIGDNDANYQSPTLSSPAIAPGGSWVIDYGGTNLNFTMADPQAASRLIIPLPTASVAGNVLQSVSWVYKNSTNGATLGSPPAFMTQIQLQIQGMSDRLYDSPILAPGVTSHVLSSTINWSDVTGIYLAYDDTLKNHYIIFFTKP